MAILTTPMAKPKDQRVEFVADKEWLKRASAEADRMGVSLAALIRMSVTEFIERNDRRRHESDRDDD